MKILFISNYYPPENHGGYELWCQETAELLTMRGHTLKVLTSGLNVHGVEGQSEVEVLRKLNLEVVGDLKDTLMRLIRTERLEEENRVTLEHLFEHFCPDVVLAWGLWNVPKTVPKWLEEHSAGRIAYYISDYWPALPSAVLQQLHAPARRVFLNAPKRLLAGLVRSKLDENRIDQLRFEHPACVTKAVQSTLMAAGIPVAHGPVIYGGTNVDEFSAGDRREYSPPLRTVFLGRLCPDKGVHTAVEAMSHLRGERPAVTLDVFGRLEEPTYLSSIRRLIRENSLEHQVKLRAPVSRDRVPRLLSRYDVLLFPSQWEEPFGRSIIEAMAKGLCVIGTQTGGAAEILISNQNALTFPPGDAGALARQIERLLRSPELLKRLATNGRRMVSERFTLERMVDDLEVFLTKVGRKAPS